jgi:hypothetical protein
MTSTYCDQNDIEDIFGSNAVTKWATVDSTDGSTERTARITRAIAYAGDKIDDILRTTSYKIPVANTAGLVPTTIENIAAVLAGVWMFQIRGVEDIQMREGTPIHRHFFTYKDALDTLEAIRTGRVKIDAVTG